VLLFDSSSGRGSKVGTLVPQNAEGGDGSMAAAQDACKKRAAGSCGNFPGNDPIGIPDKYRTFTSFCTCPPSLGLWLWPCSG
jgi:hypothetical protein